MKSTPSSILAEVLGLAGGDPTVTNLFSREEMGAMMDLKHETVSREVSLLVKEGALLPLDKCGRSYKVLNL